ncbi:hypothetical protein [Desulfuribacillus alkaliarsenatis]|uniref:DUF4825 domain-containing protein n=1 Tax=Desulfuribacillus alkaliarsenatis TaxID=766136 RepID=A0A1E5G5Y1_9FIRM|nr:hypothetical protein [Desulfuribacillus alkaliarsenatis]OEF98174.1 hypothetical protein BHF68_00340 [Desulfuribacillus alkaliarsenatis]
MARCWILIVVSFLLVACSANLETTAVKEVNASIDVEGIQLLQTNKDVESLIGYQGEYRRCIHGYNYDYEQLELNIGFDGNTNKVRRITTYNATHSLFDFTVGDALVDVVTILQDNGFSVAENDAHRFEQDNLFIVLYTDDLETLRGYNVEFMYD